MNKSIKKLKQKQDTLDKTLIKIKEAYTPTELKAIANGGRLMPGQTKVPIVDFNGERVRILALTDLHIGSKYFKPEYLKQAISIGEKEKVGMCVIAGDVTEGMCNRPDHVYELTHIGYAKQKTYACE